MDYGSDRRIVGVLFERGQSTAERSLVGRSACADWGVGVHDQGSNDRSLPGGEARAELAGVRPVVAEVGRFVAPHGTEQRVGEFDLAHLVGDGRHARVGGDGQPLVDGADGVVGERHDLVGVGGEPAEGSREPVLDRHGVGWAGLVGGEAEVVEQDGLGVGVAELVGHPDGQEAAVEVAPGARQERLDAESGDIGLHTLGVAQCVAEPGGQRLRPADASNCPRHDLEVEWPLGLQATESPLQRLVAFTSKCRWAGHGDHRPIVHGWWMPRIVPFV